MVSGTLVNGDTLRNGGDRCACVQCGGHADLSGRFDLPDQCKRTDEPELYGVLCSWDPDDRDCATRQVGSPLDDSADHERDFAVRRSRHPDGDRSSTSATGNVVFSSGSTVLSIGTVSGGMATLTSSTLSAGTYTITASYEGDGNYGASTSSPVTLIVTPRTGPGGEPALTVTVTNASRQFGQGNPAFSYTVSGDAGQRRHVCYSSGRRTGLLDPSDGHLAGGDLSDIDCRWSQLNQLLARFC